MSERILLIQLADRGDLILTTPALAALREARPDDHLALLVSSHVIPLIDSLGLVDEIITIDRKTANQSFAFLKPSNLSHILRLGKFDAVVFFHHFTIKVGTLKFWLIAQATKAKCRYGLQNGNGWFLTDSISDDGFGAKHQAQYWLDLVGLLGAKTIPRPAQVAQTNFELPVAGTGPRIVIHAGGGGYSLARRWEPEKFAKLADRLHDENGGQIILVGGPADDADQVAQAMQHTPLNLTDKTTLAELAAVIEQADLYIGTDSGVTHVAAAVGTPVVAIFGPTNHHAWGPWTPESDLLVIRSGVECSPCSYVGHGIGLREGCAARTCMKIVTVGQVYKRVLAFLDQEVSRLQPEKVQSLKPEQVWSRVQILGFPVDGITYDQWLELIVDWIARDERAHHVCTINPEFTMIARDDPNFAHILRRADLCIPDGVGMLWAARRRGIRLPERVTGSDGVPIIAECAAAKGWRLYLLGASPGVAEKTAAILVDHYPGLKIAGTYAGSPAADEEDDIVQRINASSADILFVAYGAPQQDAWIARNLTRLEVSMAMGVGGAFDFIAGVVPRAPLWMRRAGIEWLYRLYREPRRIKRQLRLPRFVVAVLRDRH